MAVFFGVLGPVPSSTQLLKVKNPVASEVYSSDGKILGRYYVENRSHASFNEISEHVVNALIATEDARFYEHRGIDEVALARVFVKSILLRNKSTGGGSTISQQIAKNLFPRGNLGPFSMPVNKLREGIIAYRLERIYTKEEILALYLNTVPFAENIFGIEVAAERFFSKKPVKLDVHEAAVIIGMLKANNYYNPRTHPERAIGRRNVVIGQMEKYNFITPEHAELYKKKPLGLKYRPISYTQGPAPYFLEKLKPELLEWCASNNNEDGEPYNLYTDGLKISTTIDYNLQYYAQLSVKEHMKVLQSKFDERWSKRDIFKENPDVIKSAIQRNNKSGDPYEVEVKKYEQKKPTTLFTWSGIKNKSMSRLDSLKHFQKFLHTGFVAIDPKTSELKAWVGGIDFRFFKYDHVTAPRQTGSTFKPFVYLTALEQGVPIDKYYENRLITYKKYNDWTPKNSHGEYKGFYTMKGALAESLNNISVETILEAGIDETIELVEDLGVTADLEDYPSLALGVSSISPLELAEAFAGIANDGIPVSSHYLIEIRDNNDKVLAKFNYERATEPVVEPENCRSLIQMMEEVVSSGTGKGIRTIYEIPGDFAGKTGTTQNNSDGWFVGITPDLVTTCWVGADDPRVHFRSTTYGQGAYMALPIVGKFFHKVYRDPKYKAQQNNNFNLPSPEILAKLDKPGYREVLDMEKRSFDFAKIFGKKEQSEELQKSSAKQAEEPNKKGRVWKKIGNIFRKKENRK